MKKDYPYLVVIVGCNSKLLRKIFEDSGIPAAISIESDLKI